MDSRPRRRGTWHARRCLQTCLFLQEIHSYGHRWYRIVHRVQKQNDEAMKVQAPGAGGLYIWHGPQVWSRTLASQTDRGIVFPGAQRASGLRVFCFKRCPAPSTVQSNEGEEAEASVWQTGAPDVSRQIIIFRFHLIRRVSKTCDTANSPVRVSLLHSKSYWIETTTRERLWWGGVGGARRRRAIVVPSGGEDRPQYI